MMSKQESSWKEFTAPDGRPYYYCAKSNQTSWEKPNELRNNSERLLANCPWKEYKTDDGKVYYHNTVTNQSSWTCPPELQKLSQPSTQSTENGDVPKKSVVDNGSDSPQPSPINGSNSNSNLPESTADEQSQSPPEDDTPKSDYEVFFDILRDKNISSNMSWENCLKQVANISQFERFRRHPERKQFFNRYKQQRIKDEKEEMKIKVRKAKESIEQLLRNSERVTPNMRYSQACELFSVNDSWRIVPDMDRRVIFEDIIRDLDRRHRKVESELRKRNMRVLTDVLDSMHKIDAHTKWETAQQLLINNPSFATDASLLSMDKEDALMVFEDHIRQLEQEEYQEKARMKKIEARRWRKNRQAFIGFLDELHMVGKLNSLSNWSTLFHDISADPRFNSMLDQAAHGSTPLDLFKFYVEDLKARYEDEKLAIRGILKRQDFVMTPDTEFSEFVTILSKDPRSATLDAGNVKLMHEKLLDRERDKLREKRKEESKSRRQLEKTFFSLLERLDPPLTEESRWDDIRPQICEKEEFFVIPTEEERAELFDHAIRSLGETCTHHHNHKQSQHRHNECAASGASRRKHRDDRKRNKKRSRRSLSRSSEEGKARSDSVSSDRSEEGEIRGSPTITSGGGIVSVPPPSVPAIKTGQLSASPSQASSRRDRDRDRERHRRSRSNNYDHHRHKRARER